MPLISVDNVVTQIQHHSRQGARVIPFRYGRPELAWERVMVLCVHPALGSLCRWPVPGVHAALAGLGAGRLGWANLGRQRGTFCSHGMVFIFAMAELLFDIHISTSNLSPYRGAVTAMPYDL